MAAGRKEDFKQATVYLKDKTVAETLPKCIESSSELQQRRQKKPEG